jgi:hypothetical protein
MQRYIDVVYLVAAAKPKTEKSDPSYGFLRSDKPGGARKGS